MMDKKSILFFGNNIKALKILKEQYKDKIDLIYIDPPYNTKQIFTVDDMHISTISRSNGGKIAYSDHFPFEEYLEQMEIIFRQLYDLLSDCGSLYVNIDVNYVHYFKVILDQIFGIENFKNDITRIKSNPKNFFRKAYGNQHDHILFYVKNKNKNIWNDYKQPISEIELEKLYKKQELNGRKYTTVPIHAPGETVGKQQTWNNLLPPKGRHWRTSVEKLESLNNEGLIEWSQNGNPRLKKYADEHKGKKIQDVWLDFKDPQVPTYPTEKNLEMLEMIVKQSSKPDSVVLDCFAGSGTTLLAAAKLGRCFIGVDQSQIAIDTIKKRLNNYEFQEINLDSLD